MYKIRRIVNTIKRYRIVVIATIFGTCVGICGCEPANEAPKDTGQWAIVSGTVSLGFGAEVKTFIKYNTQSGETYYLATPSGEKMWFPIKTLGAR